MSQRKKTAEPEKLYREMSRKEKIAFIGKACVFFISGGFIFPTLWID